MARLVTRVAASCALALCLSAYAPYGQVPAGTVQDAQEQYLQGMVWRSDMPARAAALLERAALQGHAGAQTALGLMLMNGEAGRKDDARALTWFREAAARRHPVAMANLGYMLMMGRGAGHDYALAAEWLTGAAILGVPEAQYDLGWLWQHRGDGERDEAKAAYWYRVAAERGFGRAQYNLGLMLMTGQGGVPDPKAAAKWLSLAAVSAQADVREQAQSRLAELPPSLIIIGLKQARSWLEERR